MKIGFTGASGQGKTTTAEALLGCPEFMHFDFVRSNIRAAMDAGYELNENADRLSQLLILADKIASDLSYAGHSFITDRTPIDFYAHVNVRAQGWDHFYYSVYDKLSAEGLKAYDYVFYFPFVLEVEDDPYRSNDIKFHKSVDREIKAILLDLEVPYITVPSGTVGERVDFIRFNLWKEKYR